MKLSKYNSFLYESHLYSLINESRFIYSKEFKSVLKSLAKNDDNSIKKLSTFLYMIYNSDIDKLLQNCIDISKDPGKVEFEPADKIKEEGVAIIDNILSMENILKRLNIRKDIGKILNKDNKKYYNLFGSGLNKGYLVYSKNYSDDVLEPGIQNIFLIEEERDRKGLNNIWDVVKEYKTDINTFYLLRNQDEPDYFAVVFTHKKKVNSAFIPIYDKFSSTTGTVKIGRFVNKLLDIYFNQYKEISLPIWDVNSGVYVDGGITKFVRSDFTTSDVEKFVNAYSAEILFTNNVSEYFKIVEGEDIKYWYSTKNYSNSLGQLGNSCMRHDKCQNFFKIYTENPKVCKLLILTNPSNKLVGRALLWTDTTGRKWIDRIYTNKDNLISVFNKWAKDNGYKNIYDVSNDAEIQIEPKNYFPFPYMDSFYIYNEEHGKLYNNAGPLGIGDHKPYYKLSNTNGTVIDVR